MKLSMPIMKMYGGVNSMIKECPVCEGTELKEKYLLKDYTIKKCKKCLLKFNANFPSSDTVANTFNDDYYDVVQREAFKSDYLDHTNDPSSYMYNRILKELVSTWGVVDKMIFEVGYGKGMFLKTAIDCGWTPHGIDISKAAYTHVFNNITKDVFVGDLKELNIEHKYDVVTFWDSIEHIASPKQYLEKANSILHSGGKVVITTDNYRSFISTIAAGLYYITFGLLKYPIKRTFIKYNSIYFTKDSISDLIEKCGFKIVHMEGIDYPIDKINLNMFEKSTLKALYYLGRLFRSNSQLLIIAQK